MKRYAAIRTFSLNLGDDIQTLAALRFLPRVDSWIDRERMPDAAGGPDVFVIANGWFMHRPRRFPPPPCVHPFYVSVHIHDASLLTPEAVSHFKTWAPIGCRDEHTLALLRSRGIPAYFSGCLTWTLTPPSVPRGAEVLLVDVPSTFRTLIPRSLLDGAIGLSHNHYHGLSRDYHPTNDLLTPYVAWAFLAEVRQSGLHALTRRLPGSATGSADAITTARHHAARQRLHRYAAARLVVTSRIHCFFPCLAFGTPAVLIRPDDVFGPHRLSLDVPFVKAVGLSDAAGTDWEPRPPDMTPHRTFLELLCTRAVAIQDNPLRHESIDAYYQASGWKGSGIA